MERKRAEKIVTILAKSHPGLSLRVDGTGNNSRIAIGLAPGVSFGALVFALMRASGQSGYNVSGDDFVFFVLSEPRVAQEEEVSEEA